MAIDWDDLKKAMYTIRDYEDLSRRLRESVAYAFVRKCFNFSMTEMADYTRQLLGGDSKNRYTEWMEALIRSFRHLAEVGVRDVLDLVDHVDTKEKFEGFIAQTGLDAKEVVGVLTYLVYWFIPAKKNLGELVKADPVVMEDIARLRACGIRCNLDLLEKGITPEARKDLAGRSGVPEAVITGLVNRADFSRLPWTSRATISNYIGSGYSSLAQLANADLEQVSADFYRYGESIGKNFKYGSEIDNAHRITKIVPKVVEG
jgi:hypothetical protein